MLKKFALKYLLSVGRELADKRENAVLSMMEGEKRKKFLDLGCGDGVLTLRRAQAVGSQEIYGFDILDSEIRKARKNGIVMKKGDLNGKLPYKNNEFDAIAATQVIEHLLDTDLFVSEVYRILKKGGIFVISTENLASWHNVFALLLGMQPSTGPWISRRFSIGFHPLYEEHIKEYEVKPFLGEMIGHTNVIAYNSFKQLFKKYKFKLLDERAVGYYPFPSSLADFFSRIDKWHAVDMVLKLQKK
ncbi:MAG TPA: class I SAM-dependent methyltransferase [Candidatus Saccharimonadales bacterium]|nr:class I SAM-dependent methyltransferase [Candidatus Saccharimonadales bacterium]